MSGPRRAPPIVPARHSLHFLADAFGVDNGDADIPRLRALFAEARTKRETLSNE